MRIDKQDINVFLALWIKYDPELWGELKQIQLKVLQKRIVKEMTFSQIAKEHGTTEKRLRIIFYAILKRIEVNIDKEIAYQLFKINKGIEDRSTEYFDYTFNIIQHN